MHNYGKAVARRWAPEMDLALSTDSVTTAQHGLVESAVRKQQNSD